MLKVLLKKQLAEVFRRYLYDSKKKKMRSKAAVIGLLLAFAFLMIVILGGTFAGLSFLLCEVMASYDLLWMYFCCIGLVAVLLGAFGSVFNTYASLYQAKDNELLLSLPIPIGVIMKARLLNVYLLGLMYSLVVLLPATVIYWILVPQTVMTVLGSLWFMLAMTVVVFLLSCFLGFVVGKIGARIRHKSFAVTVLSVAGFLLYYGFIMKFDTLLDNFLQGALLYGELVKEQVYILYLLGLGGCGDLGAILLFSVVLIVLFAFLWYTVKKSYVLIATASVVTEKKKYQEKRVKRRSLVYALFMKELKRLSASPVYMLNCSLGTLVLPAMGAFFLLKGSEVLVLFSSMGIGAGGLATGVAALVGMVASMNVITAPSISLEGKHLWIARSLPVATAEILKAKVLLHVALTAPSALVASICGLILLANKLTFFSALGVIVFPQVVVWLGAMWGLFLNLLTPNLHWTSEAYPVKQSMAVLLALLGMMAYCVLIVGAVIFGNRLLPSAIGLWVGVGVTVLLCGCFRQWFKSKGCELFETLS